jgi:hypothetical protein
MKQRCGLAFAAGVVFASAICSGPSAWGAVDPCSLLGSDQAAAALGVPEVNAGASATRCIWTPKKYKAGAGVLTVQIEGANDGAKMMGLGTPVNGIGNEAIQTVVGTGTVLHVRKGNTWFVVNVHGVPLDQATQVERNIAEQIVGKL